MKKLAAIIIGSNSTRMLVADMPLFLCPLMERHETCLLSSLDNQGYLSANAIDNIAQLILKLYNKAKTLGAEAICLAATSATRDAKNAEELIKAIKEKTGLCLKTLSGEEEARLSYIGAGYGDEPYAMIDIGGGSTEIACENKNLSFQMGALRLYNMHDITSIESAKEAIDEAKRVFVNCNNFNFDKWYFVGGTASVIARMYIKSDDYSLLKSDVKISIDYAKEALKQLATMPKHERSGITGVPQDRVDILPTGIAVLIAAMERLNIPHVYASDRNNLFGALKQYGMDSGIVEFYNIQ